MNSCGREGRPDMYGLGIRLGIYFQWFGEILVEFFDDADVSDIRLLGLLLSGAIVLALLVEIVNHSVQAADIYIMLQLAGGSYIFLIPIYIWKTLTCCDRKWDPLKWTREIHVPVYSVSTMIVLVIVSSLQLWFFSTYMPTRDHQCQYYGFFFTKVKLDNVGFVVVNIILQIIVILVCVGIVLSYTGFWEKQFRIRRHRRRKKHRTRHLRPEQDNQERIARRERARQEQKDLLRTMRSISNLVVYGLHITAIELTIKWNQFDNVDGVNTSGQTIPLLVSLGILIRLIASHYAVQGDGTSTSAAGSRPRPGGSGGGGTNRQAQAQAQDSTPQMGDLDEFIAGITLDNVSEYFAHGSEAYWYARTAIQRREAAEQAAARERLAARGVVPRPARIYSRGVTIVQEV
ncbi:uncharacterized protein Triagg1_2785 [Trichoderma aggressivum f. europaeum]|uniref:Uncharacterized protein n=1 Tax=Trichoderma aggressivum f. europaeum TaxID=173218 RepID=A0AAE1M1V5_9HYPO|nr:hypothetical protein Triagg1_2785 [Trichoderma aggressivum f. europaeum]